MKTRALPALSLIVATLAGITPASAACASSDFANKTWMVTATEITDGVLFFCKLSVNGAGAIGSLANGCSDFYPGQTNFNTPSRYNVKSGTVKLVNANDCLFDINLKLANGSPTAAARVVLDPGKTIATGNFLVSWGGGGSLNAVLVK